MKINFLKIMCLLSLSLWQVSALARTTLAQTLVHTQAVKVNGITFLNKTNVETGTPIDSDPVVLSGSFTNAVATCGSGCTAIARNGVWGGSTVTGFSSGDSIAIRQVSSVSSSTFTVARVRVGTTTAVDWQVTTGVEVTCYKTITSVLSETSPYLKNLTVSYSMVGGGSGGSCQGGGGGGGSSAIVVGGSLASYAAGATGPNGTTTCSNSTTGNPGVTATPTSGSFSLNLGQSLDVYVGGGGGGSSGSAGAGGSGYFGAGGGGGGSGTTAGNGGGGGTNAGGAGGVGSTTNGLSGGSLAGGRGGGTNYGRGGSAGTGGTPINGFGGGGGGGYGSGGGGAGYSVSGAGGSNGANGVTGAEGESGGVGANTWSAATTLPSAAGAGAPASGVLNGAAGGNAGLVILNYLAVACQL